jgi:C-terminal processing protease CtpA/Prc
VFFPLGLIFSGDKAYAAPSGDINAIPQGSEIISVNKIQVSNIIESTKRLLSSDAKSKTGKLAGFGYSFPDFFAIQYGNPVRYEVKFIPPGSTEIQVQVIKPVSRKTAWGNATSTIAGWFSRETELQLEIMKSENLALMSIPTFGYYDNKQKFYAFLDSAFEQVHRSEVRNLILDLRDNSGGDPICASRLLSYLERQPAPYFAHTYGGYEDLAKPIPISGKNAYAGNLYVLINGRCFSTTGHLCALLKYSRRATFVGEETGGTYECNDDHIRVQTSATHLNLNVARSTYTTAVKGLSRETGIMPEYPVEPTIDDLLTGRDAVKQYTLKLIKAGSWPMLK